MFSDQIASQKGDPSALLLYELTTQWNSLSGRLSWASQPGGHQSVCRGGTMAACYGEKGHTHCPKSTLNP